MCTCAVLLPATLLSVVVRVEELFIGEWNLVLLPLTMSHSLCSSRVLENSLLTEVKGLEKVSVTESLGLFHWQTI